MYSNLKSQLDADSIVAGDAEVRHLDAMPVGAQQHVGRLDVAMDDPFLMGVLNGMTDRQEQLCKQDRTGTITWLQAIRRVPYGLRQWWISL